VLALDLMQNARMDARKKIVIIAGPNGAGKTTFAREFLPNEAGCPVFVNADLIAAGISPFRPEAAAFRAGRLMLAEIARHVADGRSFAFETTLSGLTYARMIDRWLADGYVVKLIFLSLTAPEEAIARVAMRVRQGGHDIPTDTIRRRFVSGLVNFHETYRRRVDYWQLFDNSGPSPLLLQEGANS
jgi:predicted ABC-type ATPase